MYPMPTLEDLHKAKDEYEKIERRDSIYWSATKQVSAVVDGDAENGKFDELVSALMTLLTTWNKTFYRFHGKAGNDHFTALEAVIQKHFAILRELRSQPIRQFGQSQEQQVREIFRDFTDVLGKVGASKCLHLLAPSYFPLRDTKILKGYKMHKGKYRHLADDERYVEFMKITKTQLDDLGDLSGLSNPLKRLDEYNYCRFTKNVQFD